MSARVKVSKDGSIDFKASETIPSSPKKFRKSPEISAFYRFIYEHDLQKEAHEIIVTHSEARKEERMAQKKAARAAKKASKSK